LIFIAHIDVTNQSNTINIQVFSLFPSIFAATEKMSTPSDSPVPTPSDSSMPTGDARLKAARDFAAEIDQRRITAWLLRGQDAVLSERKAKEFVSHIEDTDSYKEECVLSDKEQQALKEVEYKVEEMRMRYRWPLIYLELCEKHSRTPKIQEVVTFLQYYMSGRDEDL
jgi:hypothetical protein